MPASDPLATASFATLRRWARQGPLRLRVGRDCMAPDLAPGCAVEVAAARVYLPGDVVVFRHRDGGLLVHRLIGYRSVAGRLHLLAQADAAEAADRPIPRDAVVGRAVRVEAAPGRWRPVRRRPLRAAGRLLAYLGQRLRRR